jgi:hypothetical protein
VADFGVAIELIRKGGQERGLVTGFEVAWWRKNTDEMKAASNELRRPKVGRMARLKARMLCSKPSAPEAPLPAAAS